MDVQTNEQAKEQMEEWKWSGLASPTSDQQRKLAKVAEKAVRFKTSWQLWQARGHPESVQFEEHQPEVSGW